MNTCKNIYEFLLWDNCNNNCKFCFQRDNPFLANLQLKKVILDNVISFIKSEKFEKGSHILIVGGEIFDTPSSFNILNVFFKDIINLMKDNVIDILYINTNLIYKNLDGVNSFLNLIKDNNLFDRLKFTTSYDLEGRFKIEEDRLLMLSNLKQIKETHKDINIVVNTILTKIVCESILTNSFNPKQFCEEYKCDINLVPYIVYDESLSADRNTIFKTLKYVDTIITGYTERYIKNFDLPQDKLLYKFRDGKFMFCSSNHAECGHSENFKRYSTKGTCFVCDLKEIFNI